MFIKETFLACDGCSDAFGADDRSLGLSAREWRKRKRGGGWHYIKGKDYCEDCYEKGKHKETQ